VSYLEFGEKINKGWFDAVGHIKGKKEREAALKHVTHWWLENRETLAKGFQSHPESVVNTMRRATDQFTGLVSGVSF
jgi:hypothetical protein